MTFLQPYLLFGLLAAAVPVLIHLIHRRQQLTVPWGAMLLLRGVKRLRRKTTRLRYWLILTLRVLALALLVVAVARPLASGRIGSTLGGAPDTTIVLLDRSASMEERDARTGTSKREAGLRRIAEYVALTGQRTRLVLIDSGENEAVSIASAELLS
ncbi:MAG: hypothetical protein FJ276_07095, partial [Planctomycetes bacterium]|nr:hypothetical protein [Planctomycetota bacterium]